MKLFYLPLLPLLACAEAAEPTSIACDGTAPQTWVDDPELDVDYRVDCELVVTEALVIELGTVVEFGPGGGLTADGGRLVTKGSAEKPVILRAKNPAERWRGLIFFGTGENYLDHTEIRNAGAETLFGRQSILVGRASFNEGQVSIRDCVIDSDIGLGIDVGPGGRLVNFERNTIRGHALAARTAVTGLGGWGGANTFSNTDNVVEVVSVTQPSENEVVWPALSIPYRIAEPIKMIGAVTIEPATQITLVEDAVFEMQGALIAEGTAQEPIRIGASGRWRSIFLAGQGSRFSHVQLSGGGAPDPLFGQSGLIVLDANTSNNLEIRDCVLDGSQTWGIYDGSGGLNANAETANTFSNNAAGNVRRPQ